MSQEETTKKINDLIWTIGEKTLDISLAYHELSRLSRDNGPDWTVKADEIKKQVFSTLSLVETEHNRIELESPRLNPNA